MSLVNQILGGLTGGGMGGGMLGGNGGGLGGMMGGGGLTGGLGGMMGGSSIFGSGVKAMLAGGLMSMIMNQAFGGGNGLTGLLDRFRGAGAHKEVDSWVSHGENQRVSPQQVEQALGPRIHELAQQAGIPESEAAQYLSELVPQVVDKMTPTGEVPDHGTLSSALGQLLGH